MRGLGRIETYPGVAGAQHGDFRESSRPGGEEEEKCCHAVHGGVCSLGWLVVFVQYSGWRCTTALTALRRITTDMVGDAAASYDHYGGLWRLEALDPAGRF